MTIIKYEDREIKEIWSRSKKFWLWEMLSLTYLNELLFLKGLIKTPHSLEPFSIVMKKIDRYEQKTKHELDAFLKELSERLSIFDEICPEVCQHLHYGLADSDITDTALSLQIRMSISEIISRINLLQKTIEDLTSKTGDIACIGRTHGKHAGAGFKSFKIELDHSMALLNTAKKSLYGKFTGLSSPVNEQAASCTLAKWNLLPAPITSEIIPRFYYTNTMYALITLASALERMATQTRLMAIEEVNEVQEGASKNPFASEEISGLARLVKSNFVTILDNNNSWWEKDTSHSSVERIVWPETFHLISHMLLTMNDILINLSINYTQIAKNSDAASCEEPSEISSKTSFEEERESTYKVISEADEVFYFEATSADEAELLYNEGHLYPLEPHTHIHKIIKANGHLIYERHARKNY
jgi:adenylosuccinate lyase